MVKSERTRFIVAAVALLLLVGAGVALMIVQKRMDSGSEQNSNDEWGLSVQTLTHDFASRIGSMSQSGAMVTRVRDGTSAARAGLKQGDIVVEIDDRKIADAAAFWRALAQARSSASLVVERDKTIITVALLLT